MHLGNFFMLSPAPKTYLAASAAEILARCAPPLVLAVLAKMSDGNSDAKSVALPVEHYLSP
jgi:hypothetical protein